MAIQISIVIPTYNRQLLLKKCLDMLTVQLFPKKEYEIIVVSDGPDEETGKIIERCRNTPLEIPDLHYYALPFKKGPAAARNLGWRKARGMLVAFTDDDCVPHIHWLRAFREAWQGEEAAAFSGKILVPRSRKPTDYERNTSHLEHAEFATANCLCTRRALEMVNGFDERFSTAWREDSDLEFRLLSHGIPVKHVKEAVVVHPVRHVRWGVSLKEQKKSMFNALLYKKHPRLYRKKIQSRPPWHYYAIVILFLLLFGSLFLLRSYHLASVAFILWVGFSGWFILKRLSGSSRSLSHISEMVVTSIFIPFLSVFWRLYGAFRFKVLFL